jgi:hypothetical protein
MSPDQTAMIIETKTKIREGFNFIRTRLNVFKVIASHQLGYYRNLNLPRPVSQHGWMTGADPQRPARINSRTIRLDLQLLDSKLNW